MGQHEAGFPGGGPASFFAFSGYLDPLSYVGAKKKASPQFSLYHQANILLFLGVADIKLNMPGGICIARI